MVLDELIQKLSYEEWTYLKNIRDDLNYSHEKILKIIDTLEKANLIIVKEDQELKMKLTEKGKEFRWNNSNN